MQKSDGSSFDEKLNALKIDKGNSLIMNGTSDSKLQVGIFYLLGDMTVQNGSFIITGLAAIGKDATLKSDSSDGNNIIFRGDASKKDSNRIDLEGKFEANLTVSENFRLVSGESPTISGHLMNNSRMDLSIGSTLKVEKSYTNTGFIYVYLGTDPTVTKTTALLTAKEKIDLKGTLKVVDGEAGVTYTFLTSDDSITNGLTVDGDSTLSLSGDAKTLSLKVGTPVAYKAGRLGVNHLFSGLTGTSHDFGTYLNAPSSLVGATTSHQYGMNAVSWQQDQKTFYALSAGKIGVYGAFDDLNGFDGAVYGVSSVLGAKWTNFVHMGHHVSSSSAFSFDAKNYFVHGASQLSKSFGDKDFTVSPRILAGYSRIFGVKGQLVDGDHVFDLEISKENAFLAQAGIDVSSHFNIKSIPLEAFASAQITNSTGHGFSFNGPDVVREKKHAQKMLTFGVKATFATTSSVYANTTLTGDHQTFVLGVDVRI